MRFVLTSSIHWMEWVACWVRLFTSVYSRGLRTYFLSMIQDQSTLNMLARLRDVYDRQQ